MKSLSTVPSGSISIYQLYQDAIYAWDRLQSRKDDSGPVKTGFHYRTRVSSDYNYTWADTLNLLPTYYSMYKITNDTSYLDQAWVMFQNLIQYSTRIVNRGNKTGRAIFGYDWTTDTILEPYVAPAVFFAPIALEDPRYIPYFEQLVRGNHELFTSPSNLLYSSLDSSTGQIVSTDFHLTWKNAGLKKLSQLLWIYKITGNNTYKQWADEFIEGIWSLRSPKTNLLPREVNAETKAVRDSTIAHYDMTGWLNILELAYFLNDQNKLAGTGNNTYYDLIDKTASAIASYMWRIATTPPLWVYKCTYSTENIQNAQTSAIPEMNAIWVDYAMIRAFEITGKAEFLEKAIEDFDTEFMGSDPVYPTGVLMSKSLVIHSPSTFKTQSQFGASANLMVARTASLVFHYTQDPKYLDKAYAHYQQFMSKHRFAKGYSNLIDTNTMQPMTYGGNQPIVFDLAPIEAILALQNAIIPSYDVMIDWAYGNPTSLPNDYGLPGAFTGVSVDVDQKRIRLESVNAKSSGFILLNFTRNGIIKDVLMDGTPYDQYANSTLFPATGIHSYLITFDGTLPPPIIVSNTSTATATTSSSSTSLGTTQVPSSDPSTGKTTSKASSTETTTITNTSEGFMMIPLLLGISVIFILRRHLQK
ncbi:MAG: hypothetical protein ACFFE8_01465 [Candidatus Heimdallarchaeota archaeon]